MSKVVRYILGILLIAVVGCQEYEPFTEEDLFKDSYSRNFQKKFGSIDPAQSWDLSSYVKDSYQLEPDPADGEVESERGAAPVAVANTRADGLGTPHFPTQDESRLVLDTEGYFNLTRTPVKWLQSALPEGTYGTKSGNRSKGEPFKQVFDPSQPFEIVPIFEGYAKSVWDLYVGVITPDGEEYSVRAWGKGENMLRAPKCTTCKGTGQVNGKDCTKCGGLGHKDWIALGKDENSNTRSENDAWLIKTKPILFDGNTVYYKNDGTGSIKGADVPAGSQLYYYMKTIDPAGNGAKVGDIMSSIDGQMRKLKEDTKVSGQTFTIDGIKKDGGLDPIIWVIGVEVAPCLDPMTDIDINDVVFLFVGHPDLPNIIKVKEQKTVQTDYDYVKKRYMCEDMGSVSDWDFNDVVFDVETNKRKKVVTAYYEDNTSAQIEVSITDVQKCTLKYLCGTIPFKIKVGKTETKMVTDPTNHDQTLNQLKNKSQTSTLFDGSGTTGWEPNYSFSVSGWDPNTNNVQISVWTNPENASPDFVNNNVQDHSTCGHSISFPRSGEVPLIIATDINQGWMREGQDIPDSWWK